MARELVGTTSVTPTQTLNELIAQAPQTLPVLQQFGLDTCCGGSLPLQDAAERHNLDLELLMEALQRAVEDA